MEAPPCETPPLSSLRTPPAADEERRACLKVDPPGFHLRPPPPPHQLSTFVTPDADLFETIHMGPAVVDAAQWQLVVSGLVTHPFALSLPELRALPATTVTSFHECYGSPLKPPTTALWRIGNVAWTGVRLRTLLELAQPLPGARFVLSDGLDHGAFGGRKGIDRYQKDLPLAKALAPECLVAWALNGQPLRRERGGPVRLVVPGFFGTNSTKWLCRLEVSAKRSESPFATVWYNEVVPGSATGAMRPVWEVEPNSMIVEPEPQAKTGGVVRVRGWAWSGDGIVDVGIDVDSQDQWTAACVEPRTDFSWQQFSAKLELPPGPHVLTARATSREGVCQPLGGRRNHAHRVSIDVV